MNLLTRLARSTYRRYFGSKFDLIIRRTWDMDTELRNHIHGINLRLIEILERLDAMDQRLERLEQGSKSLSAHWDEAAVSRRVAALEDRLIGDEAR